jgi:predicted Co/Zn/Cd cation transporter (cation efflux family)
MTLPHEECRRMVDAPQTRLSIAGDEDEQSSPLLLLWWGVSGFVLAVPAALLAWIVVSAVIGAVTGAADGARDVWDAIAGITWRAK